MKGIYKLLVIASLTFLTGCGAVEKSIKHGSLDVQTKMSDTIFLDPVEPSKRTVFLQFRNTSDKKDFNISSDIKSSLEEKGYEIVTNPDNAHFMIQANILQVGKSTDEDPFSSLHSGFGGALVGTYLAASTGNSGTGIYGAGIAGGLIGLVADAAVQVVHYRIITDLQISEKSDGIVVDESAKIKLQQGTSHKTSSWKQKTQWKKYQTRIISVATKTNLKFDTALPKLKCGLVQSISGLL